MKRMIDVRALVGLVVVVGLTAASIVWAWLEHLNAPGEIICVRGGIAPPFCKTTFGDWVLLIAVVATPLIMVLSHKAFFSKFGRSKRPAA